MITFTRKVTMICPYCKQELSDFVPHPGFEMEAIARQFCIRCERYFFVSLRNTLMIHTYPIVKPEER